MAPVWTSEQKKVIELHNRNILVSAAAGSGKTAVLVQRIIEMIADASHPVDVDKLVIVTFTNATAYEMRQRIMDAVDERLIIEPDNMHLRRQQTLINHAQITTIDSFCLNIIRNYFNEIDLDPAFKVADEGELKLMMSDVMDELIEDYYVEGNQAFIDFVECFTPEKTDGKLGDYILNLYRASQSNPWPIEWLEKCRSAYKFESEEEFVNSDILNYVKMEADRQINSAYEKIQEMIEIASLNDGVNGVGPYMYTNTLNDDLMFVERLKNAKNLFSIKEIVEQFSWGRLSAKKDESVNADLRNIVKVTRDNVKALIKNLTGNLLSQDITNAMQLISGCSSHVDVYIDMTIDFINRFNEKKRTKNIINFNDMEHFALDILIKKDKDTITYTKVADELSDIYEEILIDEYQDSNLVQELILNSISRERFGKPNVFMVGDVKQSIYRFRLARPELFIEKYNKYSEEDCDYQKIELHNNFRSRATVLDSVNEVFEKIMKKNFGDIEYDDNARLYAGASFPENANSLSKTRIMLLNQQESLEYTPLQAEAMMCAAEIAKIVNNENYQCLDKATGQYRKIRYSDITVLMRSAKQNANTFVEVFDEMGIPATAESDIGYFGSHEIVILLNLLNIIDNPRQDVPLASVLKSYFGGFSNNELAAIRSANRDKSFYDAFMLSDSKKKDVFLEFLENLRKEAQFRKIHELIWNIVYDTGYYDYVGTMPYGAERQANIDMLMERAKSYENTSFYGLFNFVRYIERLKGYDIDYGGVGFTSENDNVVKIMTIHKSKGLEFPVVFLANANKSFNNMDATQKMVIDSDLGIGMDYLNSATRVQTATLMKKAVSMKIRMANLNEEQRILYVAMTRAKEKLYVTGCVKDLETAMTKWQSLAIVKNLSYSDLASHKSYLDMIMSVALSEGSSFNVQAVYEEAFDRMIAECRENISASRLNVPEILPESYEENTAGGFIYPYSIVDMPVKMTVSELKHMGQHVDEEQSKPLIDEERPATVPKFITGEQEIRGATRGSAYHKLMEIIDFEKCFDRDSIRIFLDESVEKGRISREWADAIDIEDIVKVISSEFGREMAKAASQNRLYRERQFVMGIPANAVKEQFDPDETILVQGIIDVFYETDEGIVLADYKTDAVLPGELGQKTLVDRYSDQLKYYARAIESLVGKKIVKKIIYSFTLAQEIYLQ